LHIRRYYIQPYHYASRYVVLIVLTTVFTMTLYNSYATLSRGIPGNISLVRRIFLVIHARLKVCVYTEKIQVTRGIFHGTPTQRQVFMPVATKAIPVLGNITNVNSEVGTSLL